MGRVRVLLDEIPEMQRSIIASALSDRPEVEVVAVDLSEPSLEVGAVDVILTGARDPHDFRRAATLLARWPRSRILMLAGSGRHAVMYELYPRSLVLGDVSPRALTRAICDGFKADVM